MSLFSQILGKAIGRGHSNKKKKMLTKGITTLITSKFAKKAIKKFFK